MESKITIGIADMKMAQSSGMLITYALGSCIGICLYDQKIKLGALIHIMLPLNMEPGRKNTMKYADTGIRETLKMMEAKGSREVRCPTLDSGISRVCTTPSSGRASSFYRRMWAVRWRARCCLT